MKTASPRLCNLKVAGGHWQQALQFLDEGTPKDAISCHSTISACEKGNVWNVATLLGRFVQRQSRAVEMSGVEPAQWASVAGISVY